METSLMKRVRSSSPSQSGIFSTGSDSCDNKSDSKDFSEKKQLTEQNEVIETKPYFNLNDSYVVRKIKLGEKPGSLIMELERSLDAEETGVLNAVLSHLNDIRERAPLYQRLSRLSVKLKSIPHDNYLIKTTTAKKEDMESFIQYLQDQEHISKKTANGALKLLEKSYVVRESSLEF
jgi:hypothetical protein